MSFWGTLKGVAKRLLPFLITGALGEYRKKNPKHGWLVDAVDGAFGAVEENPSLRLLTPEKKVEHVAKQVQTDFPGTDLEVTRQIARMVISSRFSEKSKKKA